MKILLANKFYFDKGGADRYTLSLEQLLKARGHEVVIFSMQQPETLPSPYAKYFVSFLDFSRVRFGLNAFRIIGRMLYSFEAKRKLEALIKAERPDIAHLQNIYHQISPSIFSVFKKYNIPVVQTLHDYHLISPNYLLSAHGGICLHGTGGSYWQTIIHRCIKRSVAASALEAFVFAFHRLMRFYERGVDIFISPSKFLHDLVLTHDKHVRDIRVVPLYPSPTETVGQSAAGTYLLYLGRLSEEKGAQDLLDAVAPLDTPVKIAGTGPLEQPLQERIARDKLSHIELVGFQRGRALQELIANARAIVLPSLCYENFPLAVLEAYAAGKPVIAPRHGGCVELVQNGITGLLYTPNSTESLRDAVAKMMDAGTDVETMGKAAKAAGAQFSESRHYSELMTIYEEAIRRHH